MQVKIRTLYGIFWFFISLLVGVINDAIVKHLGQVIPPFEIAFFRFLFATLSLLPALLISGFGLFKTSSISIHMLRGVLLCGAMFLWCLGVSNVKIVSATVMTFTIPIFVLIMAPLVLKEKVSLKLWGATLCCFIGILLFLDPGSRISFVFTSIMLLSAFLFAVLDIINKKFVSSESMMSMLFYSNLFTTIISFSSFFMGDWVMLSNQQIFFLAILGLGANAVLYCILKAFTYVSASSLAPYRYLELIISFGVGYFVFEELPDARLWLSSTIIIASTLYICVAQIKSTSIMKKVPSLDVA